LFRKPDLVNQTDELEKPADGNTLNKEKERSLEKTDTLSPPLVYKTA